MAQLPVLFPKLLYRSLDAVEITSGEVALPQLVGVETGDAGLLASRTLRDATVAARFARVAAVTGLHVDDSAAYK